LIARLNRRSNPRLEVGTQAREALEQYREPLRAWSLDRQLGGESRRDFRLQTPHDRYSCQCPCNALLRAYVAVHLSKLPCIVNGLWAVGGRLAVMTQSGTTLDVSSGFHEDVRRLLPHMRRFARALTGSNQQGDDLVERALRQIGSSAATGGETRIHVYRAMVASYRERTGGSGEAPDRQIQALPVKAREVFLLLNVEGLTRAETASILGLPLTEVDRLTAEANAAMARDIRTDILIIEDEPLIAMDLEALAEELGHRVTAIARTKAEATAAVARHAPGLILADIELADGSSGVDAVNEIAGRYCVPAIFVTAYPERALAGLTVEPAFLLTKPFRPETLKTLISQALYFEQNAAPAAG
jgi:DNA-directed RNA polymerase specialized sigma24 family protein